MPRLIALLRAVNVAGHGKIAMADLCAFAAGLGFTKSRSALQSGNLVFESAARPDAVERRLEAEAAKRLDLRTDFFVRTPGEWREMIAGNPFPQEARDDPSRLVVVVMKEAPASAAVTALRAAIVGRERVAAGGRHLYITYPDGQGRSKLTGALLERTLGTRGTARNWNTVLKLDALASGR
jgi:uncharacterized protein (DUF1697 family)